MEYGVLNITLINKRDLSRHVIKGENMKLIAKRKSHAFNKDIYLLGVNKQGKNIWLEAASWDCDWYWGFGYIETYTNNERPDLARDINSHSRWSGLVGKQERYNIDKKCWQLDTNYIHHLNDNPDMEATVLTEKESWELADLMKSFYTLKDTAELFNQGNSHLTTTGIDLKDEQQETHINKDLLPKIFVRVYEILTPSNK